MGRNWDGVAGGTGLGPEERGGDGTGTGRGPSLSGRKWRKERDGRPRATGRNHAGQRRHARVADPSWRGPDH